MWYQTVAVVFLLAFGSVGLIPAQPLAKPAKEPLVDQVGGAINRGVKFLKDQQRRDGGWESETVSALMPGGCSALALLALLNAGVSPKDPTIQNGLKYLRAMDVTDSSKVYVVGLMAMVFAEAGENTDLLRVQKCVEWLLAARVMNGGQLQGWSYGKGGGLPDNSNAQYALLGLYSGKAAGAKIRREDWESIREFYTRTQRGDGGWHYRGASGESTLTMTTAGLCGLLIAGMELNEGREILQPDGSAKNCGQYQENAPVQQSLSWIGRHFTYDLTTGRVYYNYYGIERAGRLSGLRFIGDHDWYREGCERLVRLQSRDNGSWSAGGAFDTMPIVSTSFALLFLSKGRTPILISKLVHGQLNQRYGPRADWNNDRYDARNLVDFSSRELFKRLPLAWQIFDAGRVTPRVAGWTHDEEFQERLLVPLLEAPIVYFNGHQAPYFTKVEERLLKEYVEQGGFILAEACCGQKEFDAGFRDLVKRLFPDTPLKQLAPEHPIYKAHFPTPKEAMNLWGIELGCKTVVVYSPTDLSCRWEANKSDTPQGQLAFRLGANIVAYATGKEPPKPRLSQTELVTAKGEPVKIPRGFLKAAQLRHDGDWHPAPQAMHNLMLHLRKEYSLDVALQKKEITASDPDLVQFRFLYMHGRNAFKFSAKEIENLRNNLETGGLLFADACCGRPGFDKAFREFADKLFPGKKLERIPVSPVLDELFSKEINGKAITTVRCRTEAPEGGSAEFRDTLPYLEGIKFENRWVVIYSKYDIGCALEKHQSTDCLGHDYPSALRLGAAAILYALKR